MIFGKDYDKSLYLILKNNIRNKELMNDFLGLIPYEFIIKIKNDIVCYENSEIINKNSRLNNFNSEVYTSDGYLYSYYIDTDSGFYTIS